MTASATLVLDIGKTNVKLLALNKAGAILDVARMDNHSLDGPPYPHLDTERVWQWLLQSAAAFACGYAIDAIVPTTHGCTAGLVDASGLVLPILDYETEIPDDTAEAFAAIVPGFAETQSPHLPAGLNLGRQLFWLQRDFPQQFALHCLGVVVIAGCNLDKGTRTLDDMGPVVAHRRFVGA